VEELVRDHAHETPEADRRAGIEIVRDRDEGAALGPGWREGDPERSRREAGDVEVGARVRTTRIGQDRMEATPLVVGDSPVGGGARPLDVVGNAVAVVVVQRRGVDPADDVMDDGATREEDALRSRIVVEDLKVVRRGRGFHRRGRNVARLRPLPTPGRKDAGRDHRRPPLGRLRVGFSASDRHACSPRQGCNGDVTTLQRLLISPAGWQPFRCA
jgi:hypothetical protein